MADVFYEKGKKYNCYSHGKPYFRKTATVDGKRRWFYGDGEKDCLKKIEEAKDLSKQGFDYDKRTTKIADAMRYWLFNIKRVDTKVKATTFTRYEGDFRNHIEPYPIAKRLLSTLDSVSLQSYVNHMYEEDHVSGATIKGTIKVWKMFCYWALDEGYITKNPCKNVVLPGLRKTRDNLIESFTNEQRETILKYMEDSKYEYDTVIKLAFATGMRQGELLALRWDDVEPDTIHVLRSTAVVTHTNKDGSKERYREVWDTKTANSVRDVPILPTTYEMLLEHREKQKAFMEKAGLPDTPWVFTNLAGKMVDSDNLLKSYKRMLERAGVPYLRFHCIRHTFATEAIRRGVDVKDLQLLMGHSTRDMTYRYVQSDKNSRQSAIERMGEMI